MRILYADADEARSEEVALLLRSEYYQLDPVHSFSEVLSYVRAGHYDGILLAGIEDPSVISNLREQGESAPLLALLSSSAVTQRIAMLHAGADDCLSSPYCSGELLARMGALLRRRKNWLPRQIALGPLVLDTQQAVLRCGPLEQSLSQKEYLLMETLMSHPGMIFSTEHLLSNIWGEEAAPDTLWVYISTLRGKLKKLHARVQIQNKRGMGYLILQDSSDG